MNTSNSGNERDRPIFAARSGPSTFTDPLIRLMIFHVSLLLSHASGHSHFLFGQFFLFFVENYAGLTQLNRYSIKTKNESTESTRRYINFIIAKTRDVRATKAERVRPEQKLSRARHFYSIADAT